ALFILVVSASLFAQDTASITGTVTDPSGAAVKGAQVRVSSPDRGIDHTVPTNDSGDYLVAGLPPGPVVVDVTAQGFKKYEATGVILRVGQKARTDITLQVGASNTVVEVEGTAVGQVETQSSDLTGTVTGKQITQLELNGRNFTQLVTLIPGVSNQTGQDEGTVGVYGNVAFSINGGRTEYNNWELDGGDNMDNGSNETLNVYPSLEAIAEFKVLTSNYGAQYGRNGSGTVEVETKSGTNGFHGNVYEFVRNDAFNASNFFQDTVPPYKKNDYGYTVGGPIWKNHTFFFWSQEWRRDRVPGQNFNVPVPSVAERGGDFSDQCPPQNSEGSCPSVGPDLIAAGFNPNDPTVQGLLSEIPLPTGGSGANSVFVASPVQPTNWREELIRVDHNLTDKQRLTFRFIHDSWDTITAVPLWTNQGSFPTIQTAFKGPGVALVTRLNSTFSPTLLNEFVFSYTTDHIILNNVGNWKRSSFPGFVVPDIFPGNGNGILPGINLVTGAYGGGFGEDAGYIPNGVYNSNPTYTYRDNVSKIVGKHNLQFGAYAVTGQKNELGGELSPGSIPGYLTFDDSNGAVTTGNAFADLLLGRISSFGQQDRFIKYYNRYKILEPYFQDDWHVTNHLTLNLGLRVSLFGTYREKQKQAFNFDPTRYVVGQTSVNSDGTVNFLTADGGIPSVSDLPNGIVQCGVTRGVPVSCMQGHLFNPAPRIGFAYDPRGNGRTAIRGGYGIFFEHANGNEGNTESLENSPPLANAAQRNNIIGYSGSGQAQAQLPLTVNAIPTKAKWPYIQQWHFDVQHEIIRNTVATVSYVGSKGTHLNRQTDLNQLRSVSQNPYNPGEAISPEITYPDGTTASSDCGPTDPSTGTFFQNSFGVPTQGSTGSGAPIQGSAAVNLGIAACGTNPDPFRPFPGYGDIAHLEYKASSLYHAFQTSVRRSVGSLQVSGAYTWSHSIDDASDRFDGSFVDSYNPSTNRASSNFDQRHILSISYIWDLPFFKSPGLTNKVLGGWQFSGITTFQTGTPFSPIVSTDNAGVANGIGSAARPDKIGDPSAGVVQSLDQLGPQIYNPNAFALPRGLTFGDAGRNGLNNTHWTNFDMALFKHFKITERMSFEFRAEAFNIFNHTQWRPIAGDSGSAASNLGEANNTFSLSPGDGFLQVTDAHNPRILQLGAKFIF
ncbi:MAG TPA: carboxypeptidase regulatory-like domain-containing protein, partial [Terriglobales bacterium]|nr:carboxypeptidase regulatory-like domain-containing protein [Terriglobales bacterium]